MTSIRIGILAGLTFVSGSALTLAQPPSQQTARVQPVHEDRARVRVHASPLDIVGSILGSVRVDVDVQAPPQPSPVVVVPPVTVMTPAIPEPGTVLIAPTPAVVTTTTIATPSLLVAEAELPLHVRYANWHPGPPPYDGPPPYPYINFWPDYSNWHPSAPPYDGPPPYPYVNLWPDYSNWHPGAPPYDGPLPYPYADLWIAPPIPRSAPIAAVPATVNAIEATPSTFIEVRAEASTSLETHGSASTAAPAGDLVIVEESEIATVPATAEPSSFSYTWGVRALGGGRAIPVANTRRSQIGFEGGGGLFFGIPLTSWFEVRAAGDIVAGGDSDDEDEATSTIGLSGRVRFRLDDVAAMYFETGAGFEWLDNGATSSEGAYGLAGVGVRIPFSCESDDVMEFGLEGHFGFDDNAEHNALFAVAAFEFTGGKPHFDATRSWCKSSGSTLETSEEVTPEVYVQPAPVRVRAAPARVQPAPVQVRVQPAPVQVRVQPAPVQVRVQPAPVQVRAPQSASVVPVPARRPAQAPAVQVNVAVPGVQVQVR